MVLEWCHIYEHFQRILNSDDMGHQKKISRWVEPQRVCITTIALMMKVTFWQFLTENDKWQRRGGRANFFFCSLMFCPCFADFLHLVHQPYPLFFCTNLRNTSTLARNSVKKNEKNYQSSLLSAVVIAFCKIDAWFYLNLWKISRPPETYFEVKK